MCRKTVYYNTYGDGSEDVTERVETCRPGKMCPHPERREYRRQFRFTKLGTSAETPASLADRRPTPYATDFLALPPTPRSKSPSPSRKHESGVYVNGAKIADIHTPPRKEKRSRGHVVVHAPEPPSPLPALRRHSTLPTSADYVVIENEARGRHRHHHYQPHPRRASSRDVSLGHLGDDSSRHSSPSRRSASPRPPVHYREHARTPRGYEYVADRRREDREDDEHRRRHHRHRSSSRNRVPRRSSSYYGQSDDVYLMTPAASPQPAAPAAPAPRKEVHFTADPLRDGIRQQNERIARRPKLHQEVRGILKKDVPAAAATAAAGDDYDELRRAVGKMDIHPSRPRRRDSDDPRYWDRLRDRFEEPHERRRKSRVYYPGDGLYKYS